MQINNAIKTILEHRGISAADEVAEFLSDKPQKTYDPFLLLNMEEGVDLVLSSIDEGKKICIYGDYDTDGVTSTVLLRDVLTELGADVTSYIPSRFDDGYGLNTEALDAETRFSIRLYCHGTVAMTREWLLNDNITPADAIVRMMFTSLPEPLKSH